MKRTILGLVLKLTNEAYFFILFSILRFLLYESMVERLIQKQEEHKVQEDVYEDP